MDRWQTAMTDQAFLLKLYKNFSVLMCSVAGVIELGTHYFFVTILLVDSFNIGKINLS